MWSLEGLGPRKPSLATVGRMAGKNQDSRLASAEAGKLSGPQIVGRLELVDSGGDGENQMQVKTLTANFHCRAEFFLWVNSFNPHNEPEAGMIMIDPGLIHLGDFLSTKHHSLHSRGVP